MTKDNDSARAPHAASAYTDRTSLHEQIRAGHLPDIDQLRQGVPFFAGDMKKDMTVWCDSWLLGLEIDTWQQLLTRADDQLLLRPIIQNLRDTGTADALRSVEYVLRLAGAEDDADRMLVYLACDGDEKAKRQLIGSTPRGEGWSHDDYDRLFTSATMLGMLGGYRKSMDAYCSHGLKILERDMGALRRFEQARDAAVAAAGQADIERLQKAVRAVAKADAEPDDDDDDLLKDVLDDRAEIIRRPALERIVVPTLPEGGSGHRRDIERSWKGIAGTALPVVARGDVAAHRAALVAQWPHAADLIDTVLTDLAPREEARFKPTCLLGPAGSGKSSLIRGICDQVGLPVELYSMAGMADGSLGGTSAQWSTARESVPLQLIKRSKTASVAVIWDELEKAAESKHNGSALDTLLPMLEADQAKRFRDLALEVEVDLSLVSHFATANSLEGIPAPLRDRMRVLVMPTPGWQHLGTLTRQIVDRLAKDRGLDPRWYPPIAEDELDLVRAAWPGGSIRQLTRIVTTLIDGREMLMGRC